MKKGMRIFISAPWKMPNGFMLCLEQRVMEGSRTSIEWTPTAEIGIKDRKCLRMASAGEILYGYKEEDKVILNVRLPLADPPESRTTLQTSDMHRPATA